MNNVPQSRIASTVRVNFSVGFPNASTGYCLLISLCVCFFSGYSSQHWFPFHIQFYNPASHLVDFRTVLPEYLSQMNFSRVFLNPEFLSALFPVKNNM